MLSANLKGAVEIAIAAAVAPFDVESVEIDEGRNYDGEEVLYFTVEFPKDTGPLPGVSYMAMMSAVNQILLRSGEDRTPLFRTTRRDEEVPIESELL